MCPDFSASNFEANVPSEGSSIEQIVTDMLTTYYVRRFANYEDVVGVDEMRVMLGNVTRKSCYKLLRRKNIGSFKLGKDYKIPKINIIQYLTEASNE